MKCPKCGLMNPDSALRCDCGYDFATGEMKASYLQALPPHRSASENMDHLFSYEGRLNRAGYFRQVFVTVLLMQLAGFLVGSALGMNMGRRQAQESASIIGLFIGIFGAVIISFPVVRRLHDLGRPSSHYWLSFVPFYNLYLGLVLLFQKGDDGPNQYGQDPLA